MEEIKEMIFHSSEEGGREGALRKAWLLNRESGYNIVSIEHTSMAPANFSRYKPPIILGKREMGYRITAVIAPPECYSSFIPAIMEA